MRIPAVYKTLVGLAFVAVLVSKLDSALAAAPAESPAPAATQAAAPVPVTATGTTAPAPIKESRIISPTATAEVAFKKGDYETVTKTLWKNIDGLDRRGLILLALAHEKKKEPANMLKVANILTSKDPKDYQGFYLTGTAQLMNKKNPEALEALKTSLELNPKYQPAYERLAEMYEQKKNMYELRILFQDMIEQLGPKAEFLSKLCEINTTDFTEDQALKYCKEAMAKDPKKAENAVYLGLTKLHAEDKDQAKKLLKDAADAHTKSEFAQYTYANLLEEQKNYLEASKYFLAAVTADPKASRSWLGYAQASYEIQKYEQSLDAFKKACKLDRKTAGAFRKAANLLKSSKDSTWVKPFEDAAENCSGY